MGWKSRLWRYSQNVFSMPIIKLNKQILLGYIDKLQKRQIQFLRRYFIAVFTLAKFMTDNNIDIKMKVVFTTAEMFYPYQRQVIESAFGCKMFDQYGCGDRHTSECTKHNGIHHYFETSIMEILNEGERLKKVKQENWFLLIC